ncbi:MAG: hypothetical protein J7M21_01110, partial [Planctomycetes bacterium]|nr:hypothetical protein [Planctomycetota bacterium]
MAMSLRERVLGIAVGGLFVVAVGYLGVKKMYLGKLRQYDDARVRTANQLASLLRENASIAARARSLKGWAALTYDTDELRASAKLGASLMALVQRAGLSPDKLSLQPVSGGHVRGAYKELGRTIRVRGKLQNIVDFLYLLQQEPHLHRLENISLTPVARTNEVDLQVRYVTLVLEARPSEHLVTDRLPTTAPTDLDSARRKLYDAIASRDLFRPYIQRRIAPPPRPVPRPQPKHTSPRRDPKPRSAPPPDASRFRVVGLPAWSDEQEVLVADKVTGELRKYHTGQTLGGGTIAMVDYRPLPSPTNPQILS